MEKVLCDKEEISYLVVRKDIKNLYMRIKDGYVQINCGRHFRDDFIKSFICKHKAYILQKKEKRALLFGKKDNRANDRVYKELLPPKLLPILKHYSELMQLYPSKVGFRFNKTRWGSCSSKNSINFNYYLAKLPVELIEYVVVHELAHIKHKNHSKQFWEVVQRYLPNQKELRKKLREYEKII